MKVDKMMDFFHDNHQGGAVPGNQQRNYNQWSIPTITSPRKPRWPPKVDKMMGLYRDNHQGALSLL